jgi:hypothetical protein
MLISIFSLPPSLTPSPVNLKLVFQRYNEFTDLALQWCFGDPEWKKKQMFAILQRHVGTDAFADLLSELNVVDDWRDFLARLSLGQ